MTDLAQGSWALSWRGCCNTDEGRAGGQQAGCAVRGRDQAGTAGVSRGVRGPTASSQMPIAQDGRCACSPLSVICLHGGTLVDENSLALCLWHTIVLWTVDSRFSFWKRRTALLWKLLTAPAKPRSCRRG
jgi:hypothetical protein